MPDKLTDTKAAEMPNGGTFTLSFVREPPQSWLSRIVNRVLRRTRKVRYTTPPIPFNASSAELEAALKEAGNLRSHQVAVTGPDGGPYTVQHRA